MTRRLALVTAILVLMVAVSVAPAGAGVVLDITGGSTQSPSSDLTAAGNSKSCRPSS
jgi:hypothetical protein